MSDIINLKEITDLQQIADIIQKWLQKNDDWKTRFKKYATTLIAKKTEDNIKTIRKSFHKVKNLNLYTSISDINNDKGINLRYKGQSVAYIKDKNGILTLYTTKEQIRTNKYYLGWNKKLDCAWNSPTAEEFRKHFSLHLEKKGQVEHRFESMLIEEFAKTVSKDKTLCNIQPVRLYKELAFQMPTALSASGKNVSLSRSARAGGIDILAKVKHGAKTNLCVIELKKDCIKDEQQAHIIRGQGLAYAVFLRELLRSDSGPEWYKIFDFPKALPDSLTIDVCIAAPRSHHQIKQEPPLVQIGNDKIRFKYIYFETREIITSITSDLFV